MIDFNEKKNFYFQFIIEYFDIKNLGKTCPKLRVSENANKLIITLRLFWGFIDFSS